MVFKKKNIFSKILVMTAVMTFLSCTQAVQAYAYAEDEMPEQSSAPAEKGENYAWEPADQGGEIQNTGAAETPGAAEAAEEPGTSDVVENTDAENAYRGNAGGTSAWNDLNPSTGEEDTYIDPAVYPSDEQGRVYTADYLGFTRAELVAYLETNREMYLGTPYQESSAEVPEPGKDGRMQCEGFIWHVLHALAQRNTGVVPCGDASTDPYTNGGGWVNWLGIHNISYTVFTTKEEMLNSGILEKGDIIWSFDRKGPQAISNDHHVGFFWGDTSSEDRFWHSSQKSFTAVLEGSEKGNRISAIEGMTDGEISEWWVVKLSDDTEAETAEAYSGVFDAAVYQAQHPELTDQKALLEYFLTTGIWNGEGASEWFDISYYMEENPDLQAAFGKNRLLYVHHYLDSGRKEGRAGSQAEADEMLRQAEESKRRQEELEQSRKEEAAARKTAEEKIRQVQQEFMHPKRAGILGWILRRLGGIFG
ncbi:MAG: cell envelope integrity protein TolA [Eubacteriales bacterium]|nr:cell envelope integrity protein TolA [Eubacteriales bacterium]